MLKYTDENGILHDKVQIAIDRLKAFEPKEGGYYLAFSGGKDSQCIYHLAKMAGVRFDAHYNVTSVDPPELVRFIKAQYPDVAIDVSKDKNGKPITMWSLIANNTIPPTRMQRYCCEKLKEVKGGVGRVVVTGVRWSESNRRKMLHGVADIKTKSKKLIGEAIKTNPSASVNNRGTLIMNDDNSESRRMVEQCYRTKRAIINPIVDWTDENVWEFLNDVARVPHCSLYDEGFKRLGCIGCPLAGYKKMLHDFERWPKYKNLYICALEKMYMNNTDKQMRILGNVRIENSREAANLIFDWWLWLHRPDSKAGRAMENPVKLYAEQQKLEEN